MSLRAGLVGAGNISRFHVQGLRRAKIDIVGVTDLDQDRSRRFADEMSIASFPSVRTLRDAGANVMHVLTPPAGHAPVALEALSLGCHLFIEKPLATSAEDCERIESAAQAAGRAVCVGHSLLFDPFVRRALDLVQAGAIGDVLSFDYFRSQNHQAYPLAGLSPDQQRGGYPFRDIGIHALYLAEAFVGPIADLDGYPSATGRGDCNLWLDEWRVLARAERGTAQIQLSWNVRPQQNLIVVQGTRGIIRADLFGMSVTVKKQRPVPEHATRVLNAFGEARSMAVQSAANVGRVVTKKLLQFHGIQMLIAEFYARLERGQDAPVTVAEAKRVVYWTEYVARQADAMKEAWVARVTANRSNPRTLVTGGTGFIGGALVRRLIEAGTPVRLLARRAPAASVAAHPLVEVVLCDLADAKTVDLAVDGMDTVYHVGAAMRGSSQEFERGTVAGTRNVVDACVRHGVRRLVYMSSLAVIDTDAGETITEESPLEQLPGDRGSYTQTKLAAEAIVREAVQHRGLSAVILRPGEVVGPEKPLLTSGVAQRMGQSLIVIGDGTVRLPLVHVSDVVDAVVASATADVSSGTIVQLVEDCAVTQNDIIAHNFETTGVKRRVVRLPLSFVMFMAWGAERVFKALLGRAPIGPRRIRAATASRRFDCSRAERLLGWRAEAGVASVFAPPSNERSSQPFVEKQTEPAALT